MSDIDELQDAFLKADKLAQQGNQQAAADAKMFADEIRRLQATGGNSGNLPANGFMGQLNASIADNLGGLVDFVNPLDDLGVTGSAKTGLRQGMQAMNAAVATDAPENDWQRLGRGSGDAASMLLPGAAAIKGLSKVGGVVGNAAQRMFAPFVSSPVSATATELAAGAGAEAAAGMAEDSNPYLQAVAPLAGGVAAGLGAGGLAALGRGAKTISPVANAGRAVKAAVAPFTEKGARVIAEDAVKRATSDQDRALARLTQEKNVGNLTPAQQTGEPGLMALERGLAERDPATREALIARAAKSRETLGTVAKEGAQGRTAADTRTYFKERAATHEKFLTDLKTRAEREADTALQKAETTSNPMAMSEAVRGKIDRAYDAARVREADKWNKVPKTVEIQTDQARAAYQDALAETTDVSAESIPFKAKQFLGEEGAFGPTVTMDRLHRLYSEMRKSAREASAQVVPDEFKARQANRIADAILADIEATNPANAAKLLADARAYSQEMNKVFGANSIAKTTAVQRSGTDRIPESLVLDRTIGAGGRPGAQAVKEIRGAVGNEADMEMQEFIKADFINKGVRGEKLDVNRADTFIRNNDALLDEFPDGVGPVIRQATQAAQKADKRGQQLDAAVKYLGDRNAEGPIGFLNAKVGQEVGRSIFEAENPAAAARQLTKAAQRDKTGDAYLGLKGGVVDEVMRRSMSNGNVSGNALVKQLTDPTVQKVLKSVLSPEEVSRLRVVANQLRKVDEWGTVTPENIANAPNQLVSTFLQIQAAKAGRAMGTGTIQTPGIFVNRMRNLVNKASVDRADSLIHEALRDPEMMAALLAGPGSSAAKKAKAGKVLTNWALGAAAATAQEE